MKISTRSRYGLKAMVDLAVHYQVKPLLLKDIAQKQKISMKYLDHIFKPLKRKGWIKRVKGGYVLSDPPEKIRCYDIISFLEGSFVSLDCVESPDVCTESNSCVTVDIWRSIEDSIKNALQCVTLKELAQRQSKKEKNLKESKEKKNRIQ